MASRLSAELLNEIVSSFRSDCIVDSPGHEKRTEGRVGLRCSLEIVQFTLNARTAKPTVVWVHDISRNGIGMLSPVKLDADLEFIAWFSRDRRSPLPILYKVRYSRKLSGALHSIGAMFQRVLPDAAGEVSSLGNPGKPARRKGDVAGKATDAA